MKVTETLYNKTRSKFERKNIKLTTVKNIASEIGLSEQTVRRIRDSIDFEDYKLICAEANPNRGVAGYPDNLAPLEVKPRKKFLGIF